MKNLFILFLIASTMFLSSCAKNIVSYYQDDSENTGSLLIIPNKSLYHASVTLQNVMNKDANKLIVYKRNIRTLKIKNIPEGIYGMELTYNNNDLRPIKSNQFSVIIQKDKTTNKLVQIPPPSLGNYLMWITLIFILLFIPPGPYH